VVPLSSPTREKALPLVKIPRSPAPRYSLPHLLFSSLRVLGKAFAIDGLDEEIDDSLQALSRMEKKLRLPIPIERNPSKRLAAAIWRSIPKIYGSTVTRGIALRFKNSLNENAKMHALADSSPELFHNEIEVWEKKDPRGFLPIFLRHSSEPPEEVRKFDYMVRTLRASGIRAAEEKGEGGTPLGELCSLTYLLDFASYYTAIANGVDPHPTPLLDALKRETRAAK
jgi:glucose/mannose-6-phosphate isomerase